MTWKRSASRIGIAALALAGGAFSIGARAAQREAEAQSAYPAAGLLVPVGEGLIHAEQFGAGRDLVLIHGASGNTR